MWNQQRTSTQRPQQRTSTQRLRRTCVCTSAWAGRPGGRRREYARVSWRGDCYHPEWMTRSHMPALTPGGHACDSLLAVAHMMHHDAGHMVHSGCLGCCDRRTLSITVPCGSALLCVWLVTAVARGRGSASLLASTPPQDGHVRAERRSQARAHGCWAGTLRLMQDPHRSWCMPGPAWAAQTNSMAQSPTGTARGDRAGWTSKLASCFDKPM